MPIDELIQTIKPVMTPMTKAILSGILATFFLTNNNTIKTETLMQAKGTFEVKISPVEGTPLESQAGVGRMTIDKAWTGDLVGKSKGTMLTSQTENSGAMAYVALEKVECKLNGKSGGFYFSHTASMKKGDASSSVLKIGVVPGSGTGELVGISGELTINIDGGKHFYVFDYEIK